MQGGVEFLFGAGAGRGEHNPDQELVEGERAGRLEDHEAALGLGDVLAQKRNH